MFLLIRHNFEQGACFICCWQLRYMPTLHGTICAATELPDFDVAPPADQQAATSAEGQAPRLLEMLASTPLEARNRQRGAAPTVQTGRRPGNNAFSMLYLACCHRQVRTSSCLSSASLMAHCQPKMLAELSTMPSLQM